MLTKSPNSIKIETKYDYKIEYSDMKTDDAKPGIGHEIVKASDTEIVKLDKYEVTIHGNSVHIKDLETKKKLSGRAGCEPRIALSSDGNLLVSTGWLYTSHTDDDASAEMAFWNVGNGTIVRKKFSKGSYSPTPIVSLSNNRVAYLPGGTIYGVDVDQESKSKSLCLEDSFSIQPRNVHCYFTSLLSIPNTDLILTCENDSDASNNKICIYDVSTNTLVCVDKIILKELGYLTELKLLPDANIAFELIQDGKIKQGILNHELIKNRLKQAYENAAKSIHEANTSLEKAKPVVGIVSEYLMGSRPWLFKAKTIEPESEAVLESKRNTNS